MIMLEHVTVAYPASTALDDLCLELPTGSTALMGPSGSGKSTLLRVIAGQQAPTSGTVRIDGTPVVTATWSRAGDHRIAMVHQDYRLVPFLTVAENLRLAAELRGQTITTEDCAAALQGVGLQPELAARRPGSLSGGQQQRVAIARALVTDATVLLADEPTGALDVANSDRIAGILADIGRRPGLTVLVATHDPAVAAHMDRIRTVSAPVDQEVA